MNFEKFPDIDNFFTALQIMLQGMLGIFVVIIIIMLIVILLPKLSSWLEKMKKA